MSKKHVKGPPGGFRLRRRTKRRIGAGVAALAVVAIGWFGYQAVANLPGRSVPSLGNAHIPTLDTPHRPYNSDPPTSGPHVGSLAPWGIHSRPIPRELQVHNLEDGGVLVQYHCPTGCPELVERLAAIVRSYGRYVILAPYPDMDATIALTAWGRILQLEAFDEERITRFIDAYRGVDHHVRGFGY